MTPILILILILSPLGLAVVWPFGLVCFSLLTGTAPITFGRGGRLTGDLGPIDLYAIRLLGLWLGMSLVLLLNTGKLPQHLRQFKIQIIFLLFAGISLLWAPSLLYGIRMFAKLAAPFMFLLLILVVVATHPQIRSLSRVILTSGALALVVEVGTWLAGYRFDGKAGLGIPGLGPAPSSAHLAIMAVFAFAAFRTSRTSAHFTMLTCFTAAAVGGFTRITIAGLIAGFSMIMLASSRGIFRLALPLAGIVSLPALFFFNDSLRHRMFKGGEIPSLSTLVSDPAFFLDHVHGSGRFDAWHDVLEHFFLPSPVLGSGIGTTQHYLYTHPHIGLNAIHSEYVRILAETGVIGFTLMLLAFTMIMIRLWRIHSTSLNPNTRQYAQSALGALVLYVIFMATDNAIDYVTSSGIFVFGMIGIAEKAHLLDSSTVYSNTAVAVPSPADSVSPGWKNSARSRYPIIEMEQP